MEVNGHPQTSPRILVVDDDRKITGALRRGLTYEGYAVDVANSGAEALTRARDPAPDLVVLDIMMPGIDGMEVCRLFRRTSDVPILMLTAKDEVASRVAGLDAGADDYLVKPFAFEELLARVRALLRRREPQPRTELIYQDLHLDARSRTARRGERRIDLTTTEYRLLEFFLGRPGEVVPRHVILEKVWGYDFESESNVLEVYIRYLRTKLEAEGEPRLIHTVRGAGYVLRE
ncbi:MAG: response regulator transcription factor [Sphingomonadaceae bacterium]